VQNPPTSGPLAIAPGGSPSISTIEIATLMDVVRVCGHDGVGHAQKLMRESGYYDQQQCDDYYRGTSQEYDFAKQVRVR
jgi:hypothetical protein